MGLPQTFTIYEDSGALILSRITGDAGTELTQSDVSSIAYSVYDMEDRTTATATGTLTVSAVVYDTLQTDSRWDTDATGYNFAWSAPASLFPTGDKIMRVEIAITPASGEVIHIVRYANVLEILRS